MSGFAFDTNIIIDAMSGYPPARAEIARAMTAGSRAWLSRAAWIEVISKGDEWIVREAIAFMSRFGLDEVDEEIALRAASLRRDRPQLKTPDALILATAQLRGRMLITRNTRDFSANMPGIRVPYHL